MLINTGPLTDVGMSVSSFYFYLKNGSIFKLKHRDQKVISFEQAHEYDDSSFTMD